MPAMPLTRSPPMNDAAAAPPPFQTTSPILSRQTSDPSSSPSDTFSTAPYNHYLQQQRASSKASNNRTNSSLSNHGSLHVGGGANMPASRNNFPYLTNGFGSVMGSYYPYNPSEVELSTMAGMYESSMTAGSPTSRKRGAYAPIDVSYYGDMNNGVNVRYISGKSDATGGVRERTAALTRLKREATTFEDKLKRLVEDQEVALGLSAPDLRKSYGRIKNPKNIKEVRREILDAMIGLADVKTVEEDWYLGEISARGDLANQVERALSKRERLEREVERVENGPEGKEMDQVRERLEGVEEQIRVHEAELKRLRSEQSSMLSKISDLQSTLSSKLSSYTTTIQRISKDMDSFLQSPSALLPTRESASAIPLSPENAIRYWREEKEALDSEKTNTSRELDALKDGTLIWQETVGLIADFERFMAKELADAQQEAQRQELARSKVARSRSPEMRSSLLTRNHEVSTFGTNERPGSGNGSSGRNTPISSFANRQRRTGVTHSRNGSLSSSTETFKPANAVKSGTVSPTKSDPPQGHPQLPEAVANRLVSGIDNVISQLNSRLTLAEQRGWTLLVCCLGAELESYKLARETLLPMSNSEPLISAVIMTDAKGKGKAKETQKSGLTSPSDDALNESLHDLNLGSMDGTSTSTALQSESKEVWHSAISASESESDIDDPAALFQTSEPDRGLRMSPRMRSRYRGSEEDELEYAAFASLHDDLRPMRENGSSTVGGAVRKGNVDSGTTTALDDHDRGDEDDIHGAFLERTESESHQGTFA